MYVVWTLLVVSFAHLAKADNFYTLRGRFIDITPANLDKKAKQLHPNPDISLDFFTFDTTHVSWTKSDLPLFGANNRALAGGLAGAREVVSVSPFDSGLGAVAASVAANYPAQLSELVSQVAAGGKNLVSVNLHFKTRDMPGGFAPLHVRILNTLPIKCWVHNQRLNHQDH